MNYRSRFITIKTHEDVNHAAVCNADIVIYRIELTIKGHPSVPSRTIWPLFILQELWLAAKPMPRADFFRSPFEFWQVSSLIGYRLRYQFNCRYAFHPFPLEYHPVGRSLHDRIRHRTPLQIKTFRRAQRASSFSSAARPRRDIPSAAPAVRRCRPIPAIPRSRCGRAAAARCGPKTAHGGY
jgi:hypothetical protein